MTTHPQRDGRSTTCQHFTRPGELLCKRGVFYAHVRVRRGAHDALSLPCFGGESASRCPYYAARKPESEVSHE